MYAYIRKCITEKQLAIYMHEQQLNIWTVKKCVAGYATGCIIMLS